MVRDLYMAGLGEKLGKFIHFAADGAEQMRLLIDGLLAYSEVHSSGERFGPVDCAQVLSESLKSLSGAISTRNAQVTAGHLPVVWGDHGQLGQLFQNLVANGIKFCKSEEAPVIRVSAEENDGWWRISFSDNGIGIDERFKERVFAIFQRLHTRSEYPGTGLGLALCRKIVDRHGGEIWLEQSSPSGSVFCFTLPASSSSSSSLAGAEAVQPESFE
jgi:light-regulated signal transduction histidine kinase (bacteriophytochrome)